MNHQTSSQAADGTQFAIREWLNAKRVGLHLLGLLMVVTLLVYLGPFGTWASLAVPERLVFWVMTVAVNWVVALVVLTVTIRTFRMRGWPWWAGLVLGGAIAALPGTGAAWLSVALYLDYRPSDVAGLAGLYAQVLVLHLIVGSLAVNVIERSLWKPDAAAEEPPPADRDVDAAAEEPAPAHRGGDAVAEEPAPADRGGDAAVEEPAPAHRGGDAVAEEPPRAALLARLPAHSGAELLHLRMQDHYVEVYTATGTVMLLLRFRDALREVRGIDGLQVHRSHWVARAAVAGVERQGGRIALRLVNGSRVPVSRSFAPTLRAEGWI